MEEKVLKAKPGMPILLATIALYVLALALFVVGIVASDDGVKLGIIPAVLGGLWMLVGWIPFAGLKIIKP